MKTRMLRHGAVALAAVTMLGSAATLGGSSAQAATSDISNTMTWDTLRIGGAGFVSGIVTGKENMYLRTDVGGAYKYDYTQKRWVQLMGFINDTDRGMLSVKGIAIDPTDDNIVYFLCGCAYFSDARTVIYKTTDGGKTFTQSDVTDLIQVHGNGDGRECIEPIAIDPDNPKVLYAGGDVTAGKSALIKSTDAGKTWKAVEGYDALGLFTGELKYPSWTDHMVRGTEPQKLYNEQNGIGCVLIEGGKVYVGTSVTGQANIHVASTKDDKFSVLTKDLPTANYPCSITSDKHGNIFFTYIAGLAFAGAAGGAYKYNVASGKVTDISPCGNAIGMIEVDRNDPDKLFARTCGMWSDQWYEAEWTDDSIAWGDHFFRSKDGGTTWEDITPGQGPTDYSTGTGVKDFISLPMSTGGYDWVYGKACHWGSGILIDPRDKEGDRLLLTSGNGVFACDNAWDEKGVQFYFQPDGVEEVVCLDFVSVPGGAAYSAIGDYDGFIHEDFTSIPEQYKPNMGSTCAIAYCPQNPKVMLRIPEGDGNNHGSGYYTTDGGKTWKAMAATSGGKAAITQLGEGKYRFLKSGKESGAVQYSDDFGATWSNASGISGYKPTYFLVDPDDPSLIYASGIIYDQYWASNPNVTEPALESCHYSMFVSTDYGKTWKENQVCRYDMCDATGDPAYLKKDTIAMAAGWYGLYIITEQGTKAEKTDVFYCKTVGYGAPEKKGGVNTLFMYGRPQESDPEGIYRSTDGGKTWVCINLEHLYGGTGNGNFIVGDMNTFGTMYMSTVGCGIVYGCLSGNTTGGTTTTKTTVTTTKTTTTKTTTSVTGTTGTGLTATLWGDVDCSKEVDVSDAVLLARLVAGDKQVTVTDQGKANADVKHDGKLNVDDLTTLLQYLAKKVKAEDLGKA